ncbi:MAG: hypothetical protein KC910_28640 [Candidatus Eremiobacteraeota bacterium]|nr:hypothetical protein [Candidatus Eremiobacteraeota bacterium]
MKLELEVKGQTIHVLSDEHLKSIEDKAYPQVIDLRRNHEVDGKLAEKLREEGVHYTHIPVSPETLSEQDVDHARWEFARRKGPYAVLSTKGVRAAAVVLMHAARVEDWSLDETLKKCPELKKEKKLKAFLAGYLERHRAKA